MGKGEELTLRLSKTIGGTKWVNDLECWTKDEWRTPKGNWELEEPKIWEEEQASNFCL